MTDIVDIREAVIDSSHFSRPYAVFNLKQQCSRSEAKREARIRASNSAKTFADFVKSFRRVITYGICWQITYYSNHFKLHFDTWILGPSVFTSTVSPALLSS